MVCPVLQHRILGHRRRNVLRRDSAPGVFMVLSVAVPVFLLFFFCGRPIVQLFMSEGGEQAADVGVEFLKIVSPFYMIISLKLISDGILRGAGAMKAFMAATFSDLILRVVLAYLFSGIWGATGIWLSWPWAADWNRMFRDFISRECGRRAG